MGAEATAPVGERRPSSDHTEQDSVFVTQDVKTQEKPTNQQAEPEYPPTAKLSLILFALCISVFLVALDQTIIAPALGAITSQFQSTKDIGWYGASYLLTSTCLQPMYGLIYRMFNVKWTYLVAIVIFEIGSLICAVAPNSVGFIIGRAIAGMGTAGIFSGGVVIISHSMPLARRPLAFGLMGGMWGIASVAGPLLGGAFTENVTWRWCFYINLPVGAIAIGIVMLFVNIGYNTPDAVRESVLARIQRLDLYGAAIFIPGIICLLLALQWGGAEYAWNDSRIIGLFVGAALMLLIFIGVQFWRGDRGTLPPLLFKNRSTIGAMLLAFFFGAGFFSLVYYLSLYFQAIQGVSAVQAGIKILPLLLATVVCSISSGGIIATFGTYNYVIVPCMAMFAIGCGLITTFSVDSSIGVWFGFQVVAGLGIGAGFQIGALVVQTVLPQEWIPVGTAGIQFFQSLGGAIFIAVSQTSFQNGMISHIESANLGIDPRIFINSGASEIRSILTNMHREDALDAVLNGYMKGLRNTYYISMAMAVCAFLSSLILEKRSVKEVQQNRAKTASKSEPESIA